MKIRQDTDEQSSYDTIFSFLFSQQRSKKPLSRGKQQYNTPALSGLSSGLMEIAEGPFMYPFLTAFNAIGKDIDSLLPLLRVQLVKEETYPGGNSAGGLSAGFGLNSLSSILSNPRAFAQSAMKRYKKDRTWASIGGFTNNTMNGALFSLWAKNMGFSSSISANVGKSFSEKIISEEQHNQMMKRAQTLASEKIVLENEIPLSLIRQGIEDSSSFDDKSDRVQKLKDVLNTGGIASSNIDTVAQEVWGRDGDDSDLGLYDRGKERTDAKKIAQKEVFELLSAKAAQAGDVKKQHLYARYLQGLATDSAVTPGAIVGKAIFVGKWAYDGVVKGKFLDAVAAGDFGKLRMVTDKKTPLMENGVIAKDAQGRVKTISVTVASDNPIGKLFGDILYYSHPINLVRGALWDGKLWLRMATRNGVVNTNSVFYSISQKSIAQTISPISSFVRNKLVDPVINLILNNTLAKSIKAKIASIIGSLISAGIPGVGIVVNLLVNFVGDQFFQFFLEVIVLIFLAIIAIPFIMLAGSHTITYLYDGLESPILSEQVNPVAVDDDTADEVNAIP